MQKLLAGGAIFAIMVVVVWAVANGSGSTRDAAAVTPSTASGESDLPSTSATATTAPTETTVPVTVVQAPPVLAAEAQSLVDLDGWLQSEITSLDDLEGQVVIVHFWTFGCINCKRTLPHLQALYAEHHDDGLEIVGVHSPEFAHEEDVDSIAAAASELGVVWPIALDTRQRNFFSWQGSPAYWPRTYVLDRTGRVRFDHIGEGAYDELSETVGVLLEESA